MYAYARFFTMTGWHLASTPRTIAAHQEALYEVHGRVFGPQAITYTDDTMMCYCPSCDYLATLMPNGACPSCSTLPLGAPTSTTALPPSPAPMLEDIVLLEKARAAKNSVRFTALWSGDTTGYPSQSEADLALCIRLAFWTQDVVQIDRLFRQSGLMRDKWDEKRGDQLYGERTITEALARQTEHYIPPPQLLTTGRNGSSPAAVWGTPGQQPPDPRPDIIIGPDITRIVDEAQAALQALSATPIIYQRARRLCIIARGVKPPKWLHRPQDIPISLEASSGHLWELAGQAAQWWKLDKRAKKYELALPPRWCVEALQGRDAWPFPMLEGIVCSPTLRPDGSLLNTPGYDPDTGLYLDTNGTTFPQIPVRPTLDDARTAIGHLQQAFIDFPFAESCHFSAALTAVLSLVCRFAIMGNVPLFAIRANTRGSGKSLLADVVSIIGTGRAAPRWPHVTEDEEERKRLLTVALAGYPAIHIDNVTRPLGSPALDLALTASSFSDRILGQER